MSVKVDFSRLLDAPLQHHRPAGHSVLGFVTLAEMKMKLLNGGVSLTRVNELLGLDQPRGGYDQYEVMDTVSRIATPSVPAAVPCYMPNLKTFDVPRNITHQSAGYCYLAMMVPSSHKQVARILGPSPKLIDIINRTGWFIEPELLIGKQFHEVSPGEFHFGDGDGTAHEMLQRSLRAFPGLPGVIRTLIGVSSAAGSLLSLQSTIGGIMDLATTEGKTDDQIISSLINRDIALPIVYAGKLSTAYRYGEKQLSDESVVTCLFKSYSEEGAHPAADTITAEYQIPTSAVRRLAIIEKGVVVLGEDARLDSTCTVGLVIPAGYNLNAQVAMKPPDDYIDSDSTRKWRMLKGLKPPDLRIRMVKLNERWKKSHLMLDNKSSEARFLAETNFYVHKPIKKYRDRGPTSLAESRVSITDPLDSWAALDDWRTTLAVDKGVNIIRLHDDELCDSIIISGMRNGSHNPVEIRVAGMVYINNDDGRVGVNTHSGIDTLAVISREQLDTVSYHILSIRDDYAFDDGGPSDSDGFQSGFE